MKSITTSMNDEWFERYLREIKQMDKLFEPHRQMQEQMDKLFEPHRQMQEQMDKLFEPQRQMQEQMDKLFEPQRQMQEQMDKFLEPHRQMQEQMDKLFEPQRQMQEQMVTWFKPQRHLREQMETWHQLLSVKQNIIDILGNTDQGSIIVDPSGIISVEGETFSINEFSDFYNDIIESLIKLPSAYQVSNFIRLFLQKVKKPLAILFCIFILPFIINIASNLATPYFEGIIPKREKIKVIRMEAQRNFDIDSLQDYRFIATDTLSVRRGPSTKSRIVDKRTFGQVVRLVKKGRQWSYIEYTIEDTNLKVTGWVFNRYLCKFKK